MINYDFANNTEDYVHRIGRTGRAGRDGTAYTLFTTKNARQARELLKILQEAKQDVPRELEAMARSSYSSCECRGRRGSVLRFGWTLVMLIID